MAGDQVAGFRLGIYVFKDAESVEFAAPYGCSRSRAASLPRLRPS